MRCESNAEKKGGYLTIKVQATSRVVVKKKDSLEK